MNGRLFSFHNGSAPRVMDRAQYYTTEDSAALDSTSPGSFIEFQHTLEALFAEGVIQSSRERLRDLAIYLQDRQESERQHIAREIHDELGQGLTILKMDVAWLSKRLVTGPQVCQERLSEMTIQLDALIKTLRQLASELRPAILDDLGLTAAIEWQLQNVEQRTGLAYTLTRPPEDLVLDSSRAIAVFRIFQEALTNVLRHAEATTVDVQVIQYSDTILLKVIDDGQGMLLDSLPGCTSLGLLNMCERAHLWGGEVTIESEMGRGTTVTVWIPYDPIETLHHRPS